MPRHCSYCRETGHTRPTCFRRISESLLQHYQRYPLIRQEDLNQKYWEFAIAPSPDYEKVEGECPVCYESGGSYKFSCKHSLCFGCYYKMKLASECSTINCPMCRAEV